MELLKNLKLFDVTICMNQGGKDFLVSTFIEIKTDDKCLAAFRYQRCRPVYTGWYIQSKTKGGENIVS